MVGVAQLVRASGCGPEGCGFESRRSPCQKQKPEIMFRVFVFLKYYFSYLFIYVLFFQDFFEGY